jgi:hypothetical protein
MFFGVCDLAKRRWTQRKTFSFGKSQTVNSNGLRQPEA